MIDPIFGNFDAGMRKEWSLAYIAPILMSRLKEDIACFFLIRRTGLVITIERLPKTKEFFVFFGAYKGEGEVIA